MVIKEILNSTLQTGAGASGVQASCKKPAPVPGPCFMRRGKANRLHQQEPNQKVQANKKVWHLSYFYFYCKKNLWGPKGLC